MKKKVRLISQSLLQEKDHFWKSRSLFEVWPGLTFEFKVTSLTLTLTSLAHRIPHMITPKLSPHNSDTFLSAVEWI